MKQHQVWYAYLPLKEGSQVQGGCRPIIIISNDIANKFSPIISIIPLTSKTRKRSIPTHVEINVDGLTKTSLALCEQVTVVDKNLLSRCVGEIRSESDRAALNRALATQFGMAA